VPTPAQPRVSARAQPTGSSATASLGGGLTAPLGTPGQPVVYSSKPITVRSTSVRVMRALVRALFYLLLIGGSVAYLVTTKQLPTAPAEDASGSEAKPT